MLDLNGLQILAPLFDSHFFIFIAMILLGKLLDLVLFVFSPYREREKAEVQRPASGLQSVPTTHPKQPQNVERLRQEHKIQTKVHMSNLKVGCLYCLCVGLLMPHVQYAFIDIL